MDRKNDTLLFLTLPFLTPLIPPVGISILKAFLSGKGYKIKVADGMSDLELRRICYEYFDLLKKNIPQEKRGHFFNVALDVLFNHMMAHLNSDKEDKEKYRQLVKELVFYNFFESLDESTVDTLINYLEAYFKQLEKYITELYNSNKPGIVGLSVYKGTLASSVFAARLFKELNPQVEILMGGTIFSQDLFPDTPNFHRFLDKFPYIDKIFIGESEQILLMYLEGKLDLSKKTYTLKEIDNRLLNLNELPVPDYTDFDLSNYPQLATYTSRGCIYKCSFCAETVYWKEYHRRSVDKIANEFEILNSLYGKRLFILTDCLINPLVTELSQELIKRDRKYYWDVYLKVDKLTCNRENAFLWRKGGFYRARLGIESGSKHVLELIKKGITIEQIKDSIKNLAYSGIKTTTYWIAGHPGETEEDFQQTLNLLTELQDYIFEAECDPFRYFNYGQVDGDKWRNQKGNSYLYPNYTDLLVTQTYALNENPSREIIYERQCRFREHCRKIGIPNPYSVHEIHEADIRWKTLHKNSVPAIQEINQINLKDDFIFLNVAETKPTENISFNF